MNIRQILYLSAFLTFVMTVTLVGLSLYIASEIENRMQSATIAADLARSTSELALLTEEYVAYGLDRVETQWRSKMDYVRELLAQKSESDIVGKLRRDLELLDSAFMQLEDTEARIALAREEGRLQQLSGLEDLELRRISRIRLLYTQISQLAFQLSTESRDSANILQRRNSLLVRGYAILLMLVLVVSAVLLVGVIGRKLGILDESVAAIGKGNLDVRVPNLGNDEFGVLGKTLNLMSARLRRMVDIERASSDSVKESEERFRDFAETAADYFWEVDAELVFRRIEGRFHELTGKQSDGVIGRTLAQFWKRNASNAKNEEVGKMMAAIDAHKPFEDIKTYWDYSDQDKRVIALSGKPMFSDQGDFLGYRGSGRDITENQLLAIELSYQATHDPLTDLINRREFEVRLQRMLESAQDGEAEHVLCYLDLDQFKVINDTRGHMAGDELLRRIVAVLSAHLRSRDTLARLGGDEFGILMEHCGIGDAAAKAESLRQNVEDYRFVWEENEFSISVSIGIVAINKDSVDLFSLLSAADAACYAAKDEGRNRIVVYEQEDTRLSMRKGQMQWVSKINQALDSDNFRLFYQQIVDAKSPHANSLHYEILLRMLDEDGNIVSPGEFLPAAERFNLSSRVDRWVINQTFHWLAGHPEHMEILDFCSINLSGHSLGDEDFKDYLMQEVEHSGVAAHKLCFEITETAAIRNLQPALELMHDLKKLGCRFALDDFGSGLSSFAYLKNYPVDYLKIDGSFVKGMVNNSVNQALVRSINEIGQVMGKQTIAEFVENEEISQILIDIGVDFFQGYHYGRPQPLDEILVREEQGADGYPQASVIPLA